MSRMRRDPGYLRRTHMRVLGADGGEIDPRLIIDMPNRHAAYMHDTNHRNLFRSDYRFHSSGCTRVADARPRRLAAARQSRRGLAQD